MSKKLFYLNFILLLICILYSCFSSGFIKNRNDEQEGQRILIKLYKNFPNSIIDNDSFRYFNINLKLKGNKEDYWHFFINDGYVPITEKLLCKKRKSIYIIDNVEYVLLSYRYRSQFCDYE